MPAQIPKIIQRVSLLTLLFCLFNGLVYALDVDTTFPLGNDGVISINNNAAKTNVLTVTLKLSKKGASGVSEMRFCNMPLTFSAFEPFSPSKTWSLTPGDGDKVVWVQFRDSAGYKSNYYADSITLDSTPPVISNVRTANVSATGISILWDTNDPATAQVEYGLTSAYGSKSAYAAGLAKPHTVALSKLKEYTLYHFRIISKDDIGNTALSKDYTLTTKDVTLPKGTITINSNATYATTANVTLNLTAADTGSGVSQMQFSNDNKTCSSLEAFSTTKAWALAKADGTKTVYARFKDNAGNLSTVYYDAIILDTTPPTGSIIIDKNAAKTITGKVTLALSAKDTASGLSKMQFSNDNVNWTAWENYAASKAWTLPSGNGTKTVYVKFQDKAGLISAVYSDSIILGMPVPLPFEVTFLLPVGRATFIVGESISISIKATNPNNSVLQYRYSLDNNVVKNWSAAASLTLAAQTPGKHVISVEVKDAKGALAFKATQIYIFRKFPKPTG